VVLVGLGATGAVAARVLTQAGLEVVALEAGPRVGPEAAEQDEIGNDVRSRLSAPKAAHELPTLRTGGASDSAAAPWPLLMANGVGGTTLHYPALSIRLQPWNFRSLTATVERYGRAAVPPGATLADWPLDYDELEPYYDAVEREIGVAGKAGANEFEGPRRQAYPMPELRRTGWTELTAEAARRLGWHPFPAPAAVNTEPRHGRPACTYCGFCSGNVCHNGARGSTDVTVVPRAEATGRLRIETGARVLGIEVDEDGRVSGVRFRQGGDLRVQAARAVLLGGFVYENVRLLLTSRSARFPAGLANNTGVVGKHYTAHVTPLVYGFFPSLRLNLHNGLWAQATCVDDWNADNFEHDGAGFVGGGMLAAPQEAKPIATASAPPPPGVPRFGSGWKDWLGRAGPSLGYAVAQVDALTYEDTYLDLDPAVSDLEGVPVVRVTHEVHDNGRRAAEFLRRKLELWLQEAGAETTWSPEHMPIEGRHCYGGTRMGDDPRTSVVDRDGFAHEVANLAVLGASTFPTAGGANPTLTAQALAWRTAERLVQKEI
jgi:gluconate 2-dehydrogenase alpha chain